MIPRLAVWTFSVSLIVTAAGEVSGQDYPNKPIRIVTAAIGGNNDFDARQVAQAISGPLGQPVIVDNRAAVIVAAEVVSKSPPDGYSLLVAGGTLWITPLLQKTPYDPVNDLSPISMIERSVYIFAVHPSLPVKSIRDLIALAKARPGELNHSSGSLGVGYLGMELFKVMTGVNIVRISYKGAGATVTGAVSGEVQVVSADATSVIPLAKTGKLRALAVTSAEPSALAPGLPTVAASGVPGYESVSIQGIFAPARTPAPVITRLNQEIVRALTRPDMKERFFNAGVEVVASSPEEGVARIKTEMERLGKLIRDLHLRVE